MMKAKTCTMFLTFSIFCLSVSCSTFDDFLQCLPKNSKTSDPIQPLVYTPNNSSFWSIFNFYARNKRIIASRNARPLAIVAAANESHVQATVICAKQHGLQMRIRSGGHDYEGLSYMSDVPFVILDMFNLRRIDFNMTEETAWVQSGATTGELYYNIAQQSKVHAFPGGVCPSVGVGGHFSGGGYGNLMRKYGLSVDNIIDAQLVDVNGKILNRESMGEDLFWAIRGGGGASFGVILSWKIKLVSVPENVTVFMVQRTVSDGAIDMAYKWQQIASKLPKDLFIRVQADVDGQNKRIIVSFIGLFLGHKATLLPLMKQRFPELGLQESDCINQSWLQSTLFFWDGSPAGTPLEALLDRTYATNFFKHKSDYVKNPISKKSLESIFKMMVDSNKLGMQWNPYGGRMAEISESETPFPHRKGILFKVQYWVSWQEDEEEESKRFLDVIRKFYEEMAPHVSKNPREAFLNYRDLDIGSNPSNYTGFGDGVKYGAKYFKGNLERLVKVKTMVDPSNFFKDEQSVKILNPNHRQPTCTNLQISHYLLHTHTSVDNYYSTN